MSLRTLASFIAFFATTWGVTPELLAWQSDNGDGTFSNPVLYADYPDPDIIRVGDDFYMVSTTFVDSPGIRILHSEDLVNWEIADHVAVAVDGGAAYELHGGDAYRGGFWACSLRYHDGRFYVLVNPTFGNARLYFADQIGDTWRYHELDRPAYDPGLFFDDDGKGYVLTGHSEMSLMELSSDYSSVVSQTNNVFDAGGEGAHVIKRGDYYYVFNANPSVWPFQLLCARAQNLSGPWETGRVVMTATSGGHQGSVVELADGSWMGFVHQDNGAVGRMPKVGPVFWENDWPVFGTPESRGQITDTVEKPILGKAIKQPATSDDFASTSLGLQWQWNHNPDDSKWSLSERPGYLRLRPRQADGFWTAKNTLTQKGQGPQSHGIIKLDLSNMQAGDIAGFGTLGKVNGSIFVASDAQGNKTLGTLMDHRGVGSYTGLKDVPVTSDTLYLRADLDFDLELGICSYSYDGTTWTKLGGNFQLGFDIVHSTFQGEKYAIFCYNSSSDSSTGFVDVESFAFGDTADQVTTQRGRAFINDAGTTFVADNSQLIRGPFASTEWGDPPPMENLAKLKELGLNGVHLYGEVFDPEYPAAGSQAPGYSAARMDRMVEMTRELGLYLIITIGNGANNGDYNYDYIIDFWDFYAPRYADETHVLYEIQNEPVAWTPPYSQAVLDMEVDAYETIRSHAPDTPVMLMTYAVFGNGAAALSDLSKIGGEIDWTNAAVAFHGYAGPEETPGAVQMLIDAGYPVFMTEFTASDWGYSIDHIDLEMTASLERMQVSWLNFLHVPPNFINTAITDDFAYADIVNQTGLNWVPDYGTWPPQRSVFGNGGLPRDTTSQWSNNRLTGTLRVEAEDFDVGRDGVAYHDADSQNRGGQYRAAVAVDIYSDGGSGYAVGSTEGGEWLDYTIFVREPGIYKLKLRYAAGSSGGALRAHFNGADVTGSLELPQTGGASNWTTLESEVFLDYGQQLMHLAVESGGFSLDWIEIEPVSEGPIPDGTYRFVNRGSGLSIGVDTRNNELVQESYAGSAQEWIVTHLGAGNYHIRWASQNLHWSVFDRDNDDPIDVVPWVDVTQFRRVLVTPDESGFYRFRMASGGLTAVVMESSLEEDAAVVQYEYDGKANQLWAIQSDSSIAFPLGLAVDVVETGYQLSWQGSDGATTYNVKRSATIDGPYTTIASGIADTSYLDTDVEIGVVWYYVVSAQSGGTESLDSSFAKANPPRLYAHYEFDETSGTSASDETVSDFDASLVDGASWATGRDGNAVELDGADGHVFLPQGIVSELSEITISTWVYLDERHFWSRIFDFGSGSGNYMFLTPNGGSGTVRFAITNGSGEQVVDGSEPLPTGEWLHLAVTMKDSLAILYLNGEEVGRNSEMTLQPSSLGMTTQNYIGKSQWPDPYLEGKVDDFRIYSNAFDAEAIAALSAEQPRPPVSEEELRAVSFEFTQTELRFIVSSTVAGRRFQIESSSTLLDEDWATIGEEMLATGEALELTLELDSESSVTFYRLRILK